jgi:protein-disulfide isomerase
MTPPAADDARRRRLLALLGGAALLAAIVVVVLVVVSQGGDEGDSDAGPSRELADVSERGITLGDPDAPVTLVEFADPQCPFCAEYTTEVQPDLVEKYVSSGEVKMELRLLDFIGPDSTRLAHAAYAASEQDGLWAFTDLAYARQGPENSGYADDAFIESAATDAGLDAGPIVAAASEPSSAVADLITEAKDEAASAGVASTPSFLIGPSDGELEPLNVDSLETSEFEAAIDDAIAAAKG